MVYKPSEFQLHSVDHDQILLGGDVRSGRHLMGEDLETPENVKFSYKVGGVEFNHELKREAGSISEDAELFEIGEGDEPIKVELPKTYSYYNEDRSVVLNFIDHDQFQGLFIDYENSKVHHFSAENGELKVDDDAMEYLGQMFNIEEVAGRKLRSSSERMAFDYWQGCYRGQSDNANAEITLGGILGATMVEKYGVNPAMNMFNAYIASTNIIYENQMHVTITTKALYYVTATSNVNWANPGCGLDISTVLSRFRTWTKPSNQDIWHVVDDCFGTSGSTLGIAYVGSLCTRNGVGINYMSEGKISDSRSPTWATIAHEIGHNFNAQHSFEYGQGRTRGIMDYGDIRNRLINGELQFNTPLRQSEVCAMLDYSVRTGCLDVAASVQKSEIVQKKPAAFTNLDVEERKINCQRSRNVKPVAEAGIGQLFAEVPLDTCRSACARAEPCVTFVHNEATGYCGLVSNTTADIVPAGGFDTYSCEDTLDGARPSSLMDDSLDDLLDSADAVELGAQCCTFESDSLILGENTRSVFDTTEAACQAACVKDTGCTGVTFDAQESICMFFGESLLNTDYAVGSTALSCSRDCIRSTLVTRPTITGGDAPEAEAGDFGAYVLGGVAVGLFTIVAAFLAVTRKRGESTANKSAANAMKSRSELPLQNAVKNHLFEDDGEPKP